MQRGGVLLGICTLVVLLVIGLAFSPGGLNENSTPMLLTVLGILGNSIVTLLNLYKTENIHHFTEPQAMKETVKDAISEYRNGG